MVRDTLSSAANDARVARLRGVGLTFGEGTADPRARNIVGRLATVGFDVGDDPSFMNRS
ncbi:Uncharacterised protein [Mycobacterium tuberculosis]|nr:Uncharacterised protein [Mycobacterium tuberculosis]COX94706.1 Uncharacterised protein [Mycobacterium tuberculosis]SIP64253.1 hypothetical protein BN9982_1100017 [Mycobacterium tuberculosis]